MVAELNGTTAPPTRRRRPVGVPLVIVCASIAATQASWAVIVPVLPDYVGRFGVGAAELGLVVALFGVGRLVANIPTGIVLRWIDPRWLLMVSMGCVVASLVTTAFAGSIPVLLGLRLLTGLAGGVAITSGMSLVALLSTPTTRGRSMSLLQTMQLTGGSLGMIIGGVVYTAWDERAPFYVCGILGVVVIAVGAPLLFRGPRPEPERPDPRSAAPPPRRLWRDRSFVAVCLVTFAVFFHRFGGTQSILPLLAYSVVGLSVAHYGVVLGLVSVLGLIVAVPIGMLSDRVGRKAIMVGGLAVAGLGLPLLLVHHAAWLFVVVIMITGLAASACAPVQSAYVADLVEGESPGLAVGVSRSFGDLAGIVGPIVLGLVTDHAGLPTAVVILAAVVLVPAPLFAMLAKETTGRAAVSR